MALTTITVAPSLVQEAWAKATWEAGFEKAFFNRFMGAGADSIIQVKEELTKQAGDAINIPLLLPLSGAGVTGDNTLEGNEEALIYRAFEVTINQIRNAVCLEGRFDEKKTQINMRQDAKTSLSNWLADKIDDMLFSTLTTSPTTHPTDPTQTRVIFPTGVSAESAITASDKFTTDLIGKAKRLATASKDKQVKPVKVDGRETYVMVIDPWQARDLTADPKWVAAQQSANVRGEKNPIFSGALGMYDGVVIHQSGRIPRTATGASSANVGHALFLGAQAAVFAEGEKPRWVEKAFDYDNRQGFSIGRMFGVKKSQYKYDGTNLVDFGVINVLTSSELD
jgi:N4-gp56 family major capsid protein